MNFRSSLQTLSEKIERSAVAAFPVIKDVYEKQGDKYERIVVPFTDGIKTFKL